MSQFSMYLYFRISVKKFYFHETLFTLVKLLSSLFLLIRRHINILKSCLVPKKNLQKNLDSTSHRILRCMRIVLNIDKNNN
jgi:hypothetical protein